MRQSTRRHSNDSETALDKSSCHRYWVEIVAGSFRFVSGLVICSQSKWSCVCDRLSRALPPANLTMTYKLRLLYCRIINGAIILLSATHYLHRITGYIMSDFIKVLWRVTRVIEPISAGIYCDCSPYSIADLTLWKLPQIILGFQTFIFWFFFC